MTKNKTETLYDKNYLNWSRDKPICLSDFTAREKIFSYIGNLKNQTIADLGCGEGYASRKFEKKGAKKIFGIDISQKMINIANLKKSKKIIYKKGSIKKTGISSNIIDKTFAIFVFNYLKKKEMISACKEMARITKKNGLIYISVPHPFYPFITDQNNIFNFKQIKNTEYFNKTDITFNGYIKRLDKVKLPVHFTHHTIQDYFESFIKAKLIKIVKIEELKVTTKHLKQNYNFFKNIKDLPLHLLFILKK
jgi:ubiquinone/menaquinone biosynthesis C-methylase UbiE